jgi:hypothetical protein
MFGFIRRRLQFVEVAQSILGNCRRLEPLFGLSGEGPKTAEWDRLEANLQGCNCAVVPLLTRVLMMEYSLVNIYRSAVGVSATGEDYKTLVYSLVGAMKSDPMFGKAGLAYWDDLKDVQHDNERPVRNDAEATEIIARIYGFWFLKNIGYPNLSISSNESLLLGMKVLENLRKLLLPKLN